MMPAIQLNDHLKRFIGAASRRAPEALTKALRTPYLTYAAPENEAGFSPEDATAAGLMADDGLVRTPFPMFRFCVESFKGVQMVGFVERRERALAIIGFHKAPHKGLSDTFYAVTFTRANLLTEDVEYDGRLWDTATLADITEEMKYCEAAKDGEPSFMEFMGASHAKRQWIEHLRQDVKLRERRIKQLRGVVDVLENGVAPVVPSSLPPWTGQKADMFLAYYHVVALICYEYLAPHNFIARVTPSTPGKSVEWRQAREHMTLIHRHHPANSADVKAGATVHVDTRQLTRIAHTRRAHTRLLRSPKFRYKMGQRVAVRATWVGPKEWQDTAGQTYQILTPVAA